MAQEQLTLLIVEDDDIDREAVRRLLAPDWRVVEAATGAAALAALEMIRPDCVLLDNRLPDINGVDLLPQLAHSYLPVVVLTGIESPEVVVQAMQAGAQDYLVKHQLSRVSLAHSIAGAIEKVALMRDVEEKNRQVRELASAVTLAEQRERRRISQILHDHIQQMLHGIQMRTYLICMDGPAEPALQEQLDAINSLVAEAVEVTRTLTVELSPPVIQHEGLGGAFKWLARHMAQTHGLVVNVALDTESDIRSADLRELVFQIARELLFNVVKHAGAKEADLRIAEQLGNLRITVADSGVGFDAGVLSTQPTTGGFGLHSIHERLALFGGRLEIETRPGDGVRATIVVPFEAAAPLSDPEEGKLRYASSSDR